MRSIFRAIHRPRRTATLVIAVLSIATLLTAPATTAHAVEPSTQASVLPHGMWFASADSNQMPESFSLNAIDGDPATLWHTQHSPTATPLPHSITIDSSDNNLVISGLRYKPRTDGSRHGNIGRYEIYLYNHYTAGWDSNPVATGTFADDSTEKTVRFPPVHTSGVRLKALTEAGNRGPWSSAAEISIIGYPFHPLPRTSLAVTANSTEAGYPAGKAIDGDPATAWQTAGTALPHTLTASLNTTRIISGLRYLPRTDRPDGRIGGYQIHVSNDGTNWGNPVASGAFADDSAEKSVVFQPVSARFVRLTALTEAGNRGPWTAAAEIEIIGYGYADPTISRAGWTATTDSEQSSGGLASYTIDGNVNTAWHTQFTPTNAALPHWLAIDMHATNTVSGLRYRPRADGHFNGNIGQYQIHASADGTNWGNPIASGTFADDSTEKIVVFQPVSARFVRLTALTEAGNRGPWSSAAEINLTDNLLADVGCTSTAPIYSVRFNGTMARHQHLEPETGISSWTTQPLLPTGFVTDARHVAGPDGVIYSAVGNGELHRRRWNGTGWDTFAGGAQYEVIDTNPTWAAMATNASLMMTVDARGDIYTTEETPDPIDIGKLLHWRRYNPTTHVMDRRLINTGSSVDAMFSSGPGVLYVRYQWTGSPLFRVEYDVDSQRWRRTRIWGDWGGFRKLFSPGGDIIYGVRADTGDLMWFRVNPEAGTLANGLINDQPVGQRVGTGWQNDVQTFAAPDSCRLVNPRPFIRPEVTAWPQAPVTLTISRNGHLHYSYADEAGRAVYAEIPDLSGGSPSRLAAVPGMTGLTGTVSTGEHEDGRIQIVGTGLDAEVHSNTRTSEPGGPWGTATSFGGYVTHAATMVELGDDTLSVLAPDQRSGHIWTRNQSRNSELGVWECNEDRIAPRVDNSPLTVVRTFDVAMSVIGQDRNGTFHARSDEVIWPDDECRHAYDQIGTWQSLGGSGFTGPASAIPMPGRTVQVFATGSDGVVYTQRETATGFPGTWTAIAGITATGAPSATMAPDGLIKIVARSTDGFIYYTSQTATGAATFAPWQAIPDTDESATDPTALAVPASNTWVVAYRTDLDVPRLRRYVPGSLLASSGPFVDVPLTPPA